MLKLRSQEPNLCFSSVNKAGEHSSTAVRPASQLMCRALPAPLIDPSPKRRRLQTPSSKVEREVHNGRKSPFGFGGEHRAVVQRCGERRLQVVRQIHLRFRLRDRRVRRLAQMAIANQSSSTLRGRCTGARVQDRPSARDGTPRSAWPARWPFSALRSRTHSVEHAPAEPEVQPPGPQRLIGFRPGVQDGRSPVSASGHGSRESGRLGSAVQRHEPVGDHRTHAAGQCVGPAHAGLLALGADGVTQRIDGSDVPRRISARANFGHPLRATQLFEFQRLVLHRQFVATLALAVEPLEAAAAPVAASYAEFVALERQGGAAPPPRRASGRGAGGAGCGRGGGRLWGERLARAVLPGRLAALAPPAGGVHRRMQLRQAPARSARLEAAATEVGVPLKSLLLAAHLAALARVDGQAMQTTGVEFNGRPEVPGGDRLVGVFNNMLPLTLDLGGLDWRELARACLREERDMLPWRRFPYAELLRLNGARAPFEALFVYTHFHAYRAAEGPGLRITGHFPNHQTCMPLSVYFNREHRDGALEILLDFDERQVAAPAAERFARALQQLLDALCAAGLACDGPLLPHPVGAPA